MTNPVILLGTQSNGETLPVQVDAFGRLVAEGLEGPPGPAGPEGPEGPPGGLDLPPDPYEGALLGWLNGELAWVGSPPVPIPDDVFGPIISYDPSGMLVVDNIPATLGQGVYVYQCEQDGQYFATGWNVDQFWQDSCSGVNDQPETREYAFDGDVNDQSWRTVSSLTMALEAPVALNSKVEILYYGSSSPQGQVIFNRGAADAYVVDYSHEGVWDYKVLAEASAAELTSRELREIHLVVTDGRSQGITAIRVDGRLLVNTPGLGFRINQIIDNNLVGVPSGNNVFTPGKYLRTTEQRVAPWLLYGNDPTSLIDHLRSS